MKWRQLTPLCRAYLGSVYLLSLPFTYLCFSSANTYSSLWIVPNSGLDFRIDRQCAIAKDFLSCIMGDVFTILALTQFGPVTGSDHVLARHLRVHGCRCHTPTRYGRSDENDAVSLCVQFGVLCHFDLGNVRRVRFVAATEP
jgi:hypothetical protein